MLWIHCILGCRMDNKLVQGGAGGAWCEGDAICSVGVQMRDEVSLCESLHESPMGHATWPFMSIMVSQGACRCAWLLFCFQNVCIRSRDAFYQVMH